MNENFESRNCFMNILIVDDNEFNLRLLAAVLESEHHTVVQAKDGLEALEILERGGIDAIISDILMPRMDGFQLCHQVRRSARHRHLPFIFYTSTYLSPKDEKFGLSLGADCYLQKPLGPQQLVETLHRVMATPQRSEPQVGSSVDDLKTLREYSERLIAKLEQRNQELEESHATQGRLFNELALRAEKLTESETQKSAILENNPDCVKFVSVDGTLRTINPAGARLLEADEPAQLAGQPVSGFVVKGHRQAVKAMFERVLSGEKARLEYEIQGLKGTRRWVESHAVPLHNGAHQLAGSLCITRDITERKRMEERQRELTESLSAAVLRWRTLMKMSSGAIHVLDADGYLLEANEAFFRGLGLAPEEADGLHVGDWDAQWSREQLRERLQGLLDKSVVFETLHRRKDGTVFSAEVGVTCVRMGGRPLFFCIARDTTERKQAAARLEESEERHRQLVELSPDAIYVHGQGKFVFLNKVACALFGAASPAELIGTSILDRIHADFHAVVEGRMRKILGEGAIVPPLEEKLVRLDGKTFDAEVSAGPFQYQGQPSVLVVVRDITEKKAIEEKMLRSQRLESIGTLAAELPMT